MDSETASGRLRSLFGESRFREDNETLQLYASSLSGTHVQPACVVFPVTEQEIVSLFEIAASSGLCIYPISRGKNYGYGEAQGTGAGQIIADLSMMNRITEVNETLAYATIQPGVSQEALYQFLKQHKSRLQLDVTGGGLASSLVGNILERGFGHTDYGDRFSRIINMTVVTPQGHIIRTGFNGQHASASNTYRYGTGPVIDGLFSQSNFGIVTEMTIELMPKPEKTCMFIVTVKGESQLGNIADAIRELKLSGAVHSAVHIANKSRATGSENTRMAGAWNLSGSVSGPSALVSSRKKAVRRVFKQHCQGTTIWFIDDFMMSVARWIHDHIKPFSLYQPLKDAYDLQLGIPTDNPLKVLFNDSSLQSATLNTSAYQTCFSWVNAVCAAEKTEIEKLYTVTRQAFEKAGYEFRITFTSVNARSMIMIANTTYARIESEIMKAAQFSKDLHETLRQQGFLPYRAGSGSYDKIPEPSPEYMNLLKSLKNAFDPKGILAPGKYRIS